VSVPSLNRTFPGKVARFSVDVRSDTRTMHTEVDVPNPQRLLVPGLYAEANLQFDRKENTPSVPIQALSRKGDTATVFVVGADGTVERRTVQVGLETSSDAEIVSGLHEGEQVVVGDRSSLKAGDKVNAHVVALPEYKEEDSQQ
jgi:RND family efflux transporter MFP subunit